ncbi:MAG: hypothetical protein AAGA10_13200 [Bacteroidota bacterium]
MAQSPLGNNLQYFAKGTQRKSRKILGMKPAEIPYMKFREIDLFKEVLQNLQPKRVLEYGCGYSTLIFPNLLPANGEWISLEHNLEWLTEIKPRVTEGKKNVTVHEIKANADIWKGFGQYPDFKDYVDFPKSLEKFDLVLVDGMAREACIDLAPELLNENGILVVHDANNKNYHSHIKQFPNWFMIQDHRKTAGGFGFASIHYPLDQLVDWDKHEKVWRMDAGVSNFMKFKFLIGKKTKPFSMEGSA